MASRIIAFRHFCFVAAGFLLLGHVVLPGRADESTYVCYDNSDGTTTCTDPSSGKRITCVSSEAGVSVCQDRRNQQRLNCVSSRDGTVTCVNPDTSSRIDCVGLGMGEGVCDRPLRLDKQRPAGSSGGVFTPLAPSDRNGMTLDSPTVIDNPTAF